MLPSAPWSNGLPKIVHLLTKPVTRHLSTTCCKSIAKQLPSALAQLYTAAYVRRRDYRGLLEKIKDVRSYSLFFYKETAKSYFLKNINFLAQSNDRAILQEVIQWIDPEYNADTDFYYKASLMNCKSRLQTQVGDTTGARLSKIQAETYNLEGKKQQEKRVIRFQPKH